ncbi:hypothetical protein [Mesorhizobium sp. B2-2-2]|nr:hypothetical protein [Mesorhizobium sp. B2-2-2]
MKREHGEARFSGRSHCCPQELPIGIITSSLGAFFVVTMLIRNRL